MKIFEGLVLYQSLTAGSPDAQSGQPAKPERGRNLFLILRLAYWGFMVVEGVQTPPTNLLRLEADLTPRMVGWQARGRINPPVTQRKKNEQERAQEAEHPTFLLQIDLPFSTFRVITKHPSTIHESF